MELQEVQRDGVERGVHLIGRRVDEQPDDRYERRQRSGDGARLQRLHDTRRARPEHEPDRIGAGTRSRERVVDPGDPADLDSRRHQTASTTSRRVVGSPKRSS